jgi:hypothetical protein
LQQFSVQRKQITACKMKLRANMGANYYLQNAVEGYLGTPAVSKDVEWRDTWREQRGSFFVAGSGAPSSSLAAAQWRDTWREHR